MPEQNPDEFREEWTQWAMSERARRERIREKYEITPYINEQGRSCVRMIRRNPQNHMEENFFNEEI